MNKQTLKRELLALNMASHNYDLEGNLIPDCFILLQNYHRYSVFYFDEKGCINDEHTFKNESDACEYLYNLFKGFKKGEDKIKYMFVIRADIKLDNTFLTLPRIGDCNRPLLSFTPTLSHKGLIVLENHKSLLMTESYTDILIRIYVYDDLDTEKEFYIGRTFLMIESPYKYKIGVGVITTIIGIESRNQPSNAILDNS